MTDWAKLQGFAAELAERINSNLAWDRNKYWQAMQRSFWRGYVQGLLEMDHLTQHERDLLTATFGLED